MIRPLRKDENGRKMYDYLVSPFATKYIPICSIDRNLSIMSLDHNFGLKEHFVPLTCENGYINDARAGYHASNKFGFYRNEIVDRNHNANVYYGREAVIIEGKAAIIEVVQSEKIIDGLVDLIAYIRNISSGSELLNFVKNNVPSFVSYFTNKFNTEHNKTVLITENYKDFNLLNRIEPSIITRTGDEKIFVSYEEMMQLVFSYVEYKPFSSFDEPQEILREALEGLSQ